MNIVFVGYRHGHTASIYQDAMRNPEINVLGGWEPTEVGREMAAGTGLEFNYPTLESVLEDPNVDAISLGGVYGERGAHAIAALKAGKHVYGDKPICTTMEELEEIERLAKEKNLKVGCYLSMRFSNGMKTIREMIANGDIGEVGAIDMTAQHPLNYGSRPMWYFEKGKHGGTINDIAIHGVDIVRFLTGLGIKSVTAARTWNHFATQEPDFKDCGQFMAELENGAGLMMDVSYAAPSSCGFKLETYWRFTIWGTKGVIEYKLNGGPSAKTIDSDDGALVQVALNGADGFVAYPKAKYPVTPLGEFLKEIRGEETIINTEDVIRTSREVLTVQAVADK